MASNAPDGNEGIQTSAAARPSRTRLIIALTLLAFIGGLAAMAWMMSHWQGGLRFGAVPEDPAAVATPGNDMANGSDAGDGTQDMPAAATTRAPAVVMGSDQTEVQVSALEQRLTRIAVAAESASSYANRAEAMMVAFAARRALDAGSPLGYVEGQLRVLFGSAQPKAVATIVNAAAEPVTLATLRAGLDRIGNVVARGDPGESWWSGAMRELRGLVVIRRADAPSPAASERIVRARLNIESGQIEAAIAEVSALAPHAETDQWLEQARRYNEAHRALDVIEAAAILEPRTAPMLPAAPAAPVAPIGPVAPPPVR